MVKIATALLSVLAAVLLAAPLSAQTTQPATAGTTASTPTAVIELSGKIDDWERDMLFRRFDEARRAGAKTVILQIDTYGGLVTSGLDISRYIKRQTDLHTIGFVHEKAISAGAMIAMSCNEIVMEPGATIGDCAPIVYRTDGTLEGLPAAERAKAESPILSDFRDSASRNGYDLLLAEAMVSVDRVVHYVSNEAGEKRFIDDADYKKLITEGWKPVTGVRDPLDTAAELLTLSSDQATKVGLSKSEFNAP